MSKYLSRRRFMQLAGISAVGAGGYYSATEYWPRVYLGIDQEAPRPVAKSGLNILMIMVDQERAWHTMPSNLLLPVRTVFAAGATVFDKYHVNTAPCSPSRSVIYTGQHIQQTRVTDNTNIGPAMSTSIPTIGAMLRDAGYYTAYKGKWHLGDIHPPRGGDNSAVLEDYGFSDYGSDPGYGETLAGFKNDAGIAEDTAKWLQTTGKNTDTPWFMACNFVNPHDIMFFDATGEQHTRRTSNDFIGSVMPAPNTPLYQTDLGLGLPRDLRENDPSTRPATHAEFKKFNAFFYGDVPIENEDAWARYQNYYCNCIRDVDRHIGSVLTALEASGQADRTIVVLSSDHGEMGGVHGCRSKGPFIYKENLNVPLAIRHPDVATGGQTPALASAVDLAPTLLSLAGLSETAISARYPGLKGHVLADSLGRSEPGKRDNLAGGILVNYSVIHHIDALFFEKVAKLTTLRSMSQKIRALVETPLYPDLNHRGFMRGVIGSRYKFARYFSPLQHHQPDSWESLIALNDIELYDTHSDPGELLNLALEPEKHREIILAQNARVNWLLAQEAGVDDGSYMKGPEHLWRL